MIPCRHAFIKKNRIRLITVVAALLVICTLIGIWVTTNTESVTASTTFLGKIDIGGYSLYTNCCGKGTPTVIFESGLGEGNGIWAYIKQQISPITRTFSYDRAGIGISDKSNLERTSLNEVYELHTLLKNTKVKGPYIIVAHSIGGYNARLFAGTYPNEVAGIVFVDCSHENQYDNMSQEEIETRKKQLVGCPEQNLDELIISSNQVKEIRKKDSLRNIPITVLTAEDTLTVVSSWADFQNDLASLSNNSKHAIVEGSGHMMQYDKPQVIIDAIKDMINEVRK